MGASKRRLGSGRKACLPQFARAASSVELPPSGIRAGLLLATAGTTTATGAAWVLAELLEEVVAAWEVVEEVVAWEVVEVVAWGVVEEVVAWGVAVGD